MGSTVRLDSDSTLETNEMCTAKSKSTRVCLIVGNDFPPFEAKSLVLLFSHDNTVAFLKFKLL